jgi:TonB-dependent receptor
MKKQLLFILLLMGASYMVLAQNGLVTGTVKDGTTGDNLAGATVVVRGSTLGSATNLQGVFSFSIAPGEYDLHVRYIGYEEGTAKVTVVAGETAIVDVGLTTNSVELSGLEITGTLQGQARALNQQRAADNIKNIVAADQIGRFPDPNAAEALQRIPGVNIERDQGEGRYVLVRGLSPQFTNISVNGEQIPSPEADVRFVALDAIPADQLASMEVTKALTPDMDGDAVGGNVNLITRTAQSAKPSVNGSVLGGYNALMNQPNVQGSIMYGQRFGANEKLGVLVNTSYYQNQLGSDNWEREPFDNELELRDYQLTRTRTGLSGTFDYKLNRTSELYVRALYTRFTDREWRRRYIFKPEDEEIEKQTKDRFEAQAITSVNVGGKHVLPGISIDYEAQYSYGEQDTPFDREATFIAGLPSDLTFSGGNYPGLDAPGYLDNSAYEFDGFESGNTLAKDQNITAKVNIGLPYSMGGTEGLLKFGGKYRAKVKSYSITQNVYGARGDVPNLDAFEGGLLDNSFLGGEYELSAPLDVNGVVRYFNSHPADFELEIEDKSIDEALESFEANENVTAAYVMARQQYEKLMLLGGVRFENTSVEYKSSDVVISPSGDLLEIRPVAGSSDYSFVLPQFHAKYTLGQFSNLRAALTWSYARPNFSQIVPSQEANLEDREATVGNATLQPVKAVNIDVLGEHYFGTVGIISGGFFYKQLDGFIYPKILYNSQYPLTGTPVATDIRVTQSQNGGTGNIYGFEFNVQRNLDFLPGALSGFNVYFNYTFTNSDATIQNREEGEDDPDATETIRLPGQARNVGNVALGYDYRKVSARLSANFNGEYLSEVGGSIEEDLYVANRIQLDFSANYSISSNFRVFAEFLNITNQPFEAYVGDKDTVIQKEYYSWWSRAGLKFNF